jgi:branched-chain amino acid transport system ATP-binding protein
MVDTVFGVIRDIARDGVTLLLVEQNARLALSLCDRGYVMDSGRITLAAASAGLLDNPAVRAAYLGE